MTRLSLSLSLLLVLVLASYFGTASAHGAEIQVSTEESILAVVTHKAGLGARLAHNHLIAADGDGLEDGDLEFHFDPQAPLETTFKLRIQSEELLVDQNDLQQRWFPRLQTLAILDEPFGEISSNDRQKIRQSMLGKSQLNSADFAEIGAEIRGIEEQSSTYGSVEFPYQVQLAFTLRDKTVQQTAAARFETTGGKVTIEAVGIFRFSDFGIKPYSAMLGAVKNQDEVHLYVHLQGALAEAEGSSETED